jgi:hypothetical protein
VPFLVESRGLLEDWLPLDDGDGRAGGDITAIDIVPDGATSAGGPRLVAPAPGDAVAPDRMRAHVAPGASVEVPLVGRCGAGEGAFLALVPTNQAGGAGDDGPGGAGDVIVIEPGRGQARRDGGCRAWLPVGWRFGGR